MGRNVRWSWGSALIGAASAGAAAALFQAKPKDPTFHLISISFTSFKLNVPVLDAEVSAGHQSPRSCQLLRLPARLDGMELAHHAAKFLADVARREMVLEARVMIEGTAKVLWWNHRFKVHVESHVTVDPVFLDVIDQENRSELDVFVG
ncbi:hypothetical protein SAY87_016252 [Trapa incisa]|uniref:Late embryogenesis abundant protein LEA-2 subgroup domain-containing protein n=1 Tax=Trapa incisa TaxID=236973 RepID=A0AAN7L6H8_9MYRT|nr:hypothetical protein SAY87_016252 [Trapa incisa]